MKRYFITGAQGFVGRYLVSSILESYDGAEILGVGRSPSQNHSFTHYVSWAGKSVPAPLPPLLKNIDCGRYRYVSLNVHQCEQLTPVLHDFRPDVVIHLASALRDDPFESLLTTNVEGTVNLLNAAATTGHRIEKIVLGSTCGVYGSPAKLPILEDAPCHPVDLYSTTKLAAEHASHIVALRTDLPVVWARLFNLAGPGQDERHICGRVASQAAAIIEGFTPGVIEVESLETTRDFIDVRDVASALVGICEHGSPHSVYNVGSGIETSMKAILDMTLESAGLTNRVTVRQKMARFGDISRHVASIEKLRSLGLECRYSLRQTIRDILDYYRGRVRHRALTAMDTALAPELAIAYRTTSLPKSTTIL
jgi:GDP-4-dehydro-6-deoxy-D-mannose reductase